MRAGGTTEAGLALKRTLQSANQEAGHNLHSLSSDWLLGFLRRSELKNKL